MASKRKSSKKVTVIPSARRLVSSLRDLGYDFVQSVADLIDNSIEAGATRINIEIRFEGADSWLRIADNGQGMTGAEITEAMRYGTQRTYAADELGRFGLGLKTASLAQCRRLSVASRMKGQREVEVRCLDLDHITETDKWEILVLGATERSKDLVAHLERGQGTVVLWESLDRVLGYKMPWGDRAKAGLLALAEQLDVHLGMVFHRFLTGEVKGRKKLSILTNGTDVSTWDPFARAESATQTLPGCELDVQASDGVGLVRFQPYVLPARESFSTEREFHRLGGPGKWNAQQGFYIYRSNRMIQSGGWCRMRAPDEHVKLARCSIDFYPDLDSAFGVNVAKTKMSLPADLREKLKGPVEHLVRQAQKVYRESGGEGHESGRGPKGMPKGGSGGGTSRGGAPGARGALEAAANEVGEESALKRIVRQLKKMAPEVARDLGW